MTSNLFITGVTGYIAGDALHLLYAAHPQLHYSVLCRTEEKAQLIKQAFPDVRIVIGDLDNEDLLESEAARADIVLHAADASDHMIAAKAISRGLVKGHSRDRPGYWLHTGGSGILTYFDSHDGRFGEWSDKEFDDDQGVSHVTSLPDDAFHRNVDKVVLKTGTQHGDVVKTAIISPPTIYGRGRGPVSRRGRQVYALAHYIIQHGHAPLAGKGLARWDNVHVHDLSSLYLLLVEAAMSANVSDDAWGAKGYYFAENGRHQWGELAQAMARTAADLKYIPANPPAEQINREKALETAGFEAVSWGLNSLGQGSRAKRVLQWQPTQPSLETEVANILGDEKRRMTH